MRIFRQQFPRAADTYLKVGRQFTRLGSCLAYGLGCFRARIAPSQLTRTAYVFGSMLMPNTWPTRAAPPSLQYGAGTASLNVAVAASIILHHFAHWAGYPERQREVRLAATFKWCRCDALLTCISAVQMCVSLHNSCSVLPPARLLRQQLLATPRHACPTPGLLAPIAQSIAARIAHRCRFACLLAAHFLSAGPEVCSGGAAATHRPPQLRAPDRRAISGRKGTAGSRSSFGRCRRCGPAGTV